MGSSYNLPGVVGPSSSTDNALARFDATTGKLLQNGVATQDDSGNLTALRFIATGGTGFTDVSIHGVDANTGIYFDSGRMIAAGGGQSQWKVEAFNLDLYDTANVLSVRCGQRTLTGTSFQTLLAWADALVSVTVPFGLKSYTVATAPSAATAGAGAMIFFTDSAVAPVAGISNGTVWKRADNAATTVI